MSSVDLKVGHPMVFLFDDTYRPYRMRPWMPQLDIRLECAFLEHTLTTLGVKFPTDPREDLVIHHSVRLDDLAAQPLRFAPSDASQSHLCIQRRTTLLICYLLNVHLYYHFRTWRGQEHR